MKLAIGAFNGWRCPRCKKLVAKPKDADMGKCKSCGEEVLFKHPLQRMVEANMGDTWKKPIQGDLDETCKKHIHEVNEADRIMQERYSAAARLRAERIEREKKDLGIIDTLEEMEKRVEEDWKRRKDEVAGVEIPVKIIRGGDSRGRPVVVNFLNRPILLKTFEKFGKEKELFLSEVVIGFAAKGLKAYLGERKKNAETQK